MTPPSPIQSDCKRRQGVCAGVCERVHQFHHFRSQREVPSGETQDDKRGRHPVRDVHAGFRHVCGASEALPAEVQRGSVNIFNAVPSHIIEVRAFWKHFAQLSEVCLSLTFVCMFSGYERRERHKHCNCNRRHGRGAD